MFNPNVNFILNSNNQIFKFELTDDKKIIYTIYDFLLTPLESSTLNDANILKYAVLIDENECIHLAVLLSTGELNYHKYESNMWSKATIAKFDLRSNLYNQIELLMINKKLNVLFNYSNLINSNIWTIQHVIYGTNEKHNAIRYITKKYLIHLVLILIVKVLYICFIGLLQIIFHKSIMDFTVLLLNHGTL